MTLRPPATTGETLPPRCPTESGSDFAPSNSARYALIGRDVILEDTPPSLIGPASGGGDTPLSDL
ncbi:uncharacterized protein V6R79_021061 [Siganus canaliculatus]